MEPDTTDLAGQLSQWTQRLNERQEALQSELQRLQIFRNDYDALEKTLGTLPDQTSRSAMIPLGKLAFMPGKLIHTNEVTVYLGDQYYAERSAKQALGILERRKEVVDENLRLLEAQVNAVQSKTEAGQDSLPSADLGVNEEGLPIVEIREDIAEEKTPAVAEASKTASRPKIETWSEKDQNDVMAMLQRLEEEEEEEEEKLEQNSEQKPKDSTESDDEYDDEDWQHYDTEIADNLFASFEDDEDYATQGIVDQVDSTVYDEEDLKEPRVYELDEEVAPAEQPVSVATEPVVEESPLKESVAEKTPVPQQSEQEATDPTTDIPAPTKAKKPSRFKVARQKERIRPSVNKTEAVDQPPKAEKQAVESEIPAVVESPKGKNVEESASKGIPTVQESSLEESAKPKKVSRFKQAREQERVAIKSPSTTTASPPSNSEKRPSKFKLTRQHGHGRPQDAGTDFTAVAVDKIPAIHDTRKPIKDEEKPSKDEEDKVISKPKRKVTWDEVATVQEHDRSAAPSTVSSDTASLTYTAPVKGATNEKSYPLPQRVIKSPADIFSALQDQRQILLDDGYPSLETEEDNIHDNLDINSLTKDANFASQEIWRLKDEPDNPLMAPAMQSELKEPPPAKKTKLDSNTMKGAVVERETEPVDLEAVEQDMDLREVTSKYHNQRNSLMAAMGGYSFEPKDVYEVYDEDIPSLQSNSKEIVDDEPEEKPKKVSRFKAARMAALEKDAQ